MVVNVVPGLPRTGIAPGSLQGMSVILCEERIRLMVFPVKDGFGVGGARVGGEGGVARAVKRLFSRCEQLK